MFIPLLLSSSIYPEDESTETVVLALANTVKKKGELLSKWAVMYESMFGVTESHSISPAHSLDLSKLADGGVITTDTCYTARKISRLLCDEVELAAATEK